MMSGCGGEDDLSSDAVPTTPDTPTKPTGNQPAEEEYSFMRQLRIRSPRKYNEYKKKIMKHSELFGELKKIGDVLMVCSEEDNKAAGDYCTYLQTLLMGGGPLQPTVRVKASLMNDVVLPGESVFRGPEMQLTRFTFNFLYITGRSHKNDNGLFSHYQQMCKIEGIKTEEKEGCLAVVYTDIIPDDIPSWLQGEMIISASDRSKDTENALIKKLESKLYLREAKEKKFIEEKIEAFYLEGWNYLK